MLHQKKKKSYGTTKHVLIDGRPVIYKQWFLKGLIYFQHLCDEEGNWLKYQDFTCKYTWLFLTVSWFGKLHKGSKPKKQ